MTTPEGSCAWLSLAGVVSFYQQTPYRTSIAGMLSQTLKHPQGNVGPTGFRMASTAAQMKHHDRRSHHATSD